MIASRLFLALTGLAALTGCRADRGPDSALLESREKEVKQRIESGSVSEEPLAKWILPDVLREVSGIAALDDGRIVAHNDERARVYVIDPMRGVILKYFNLGKGGIVADFEAIAVSGADMYMLTSNGDVYQFREGDDRATVEFTRHATNLGKECEFESLEIEAGTGAFIMPCKRVDKKSERNQVKIYRWLRQPGGAAAVSSISVPLADAIGSNDWKELSPSDVAIDRRSGNYLIVTGPEKALLEITPSGQVVRSMPVPGDPQQPEGIAITRDGVLIIADEGVARPADITMYSWQGLTGDTPPAPADTTAVPAASPVSNDSKIGDTSE
ncbi:MAG: SdiA-regulated domain-containing protein [Gemmatimonadota bacterium]|nr:SdiA-regulated domain-containing protein [Gemmatimonadota bacterium]